MLDQGPGKGASPAPADEEPDEDAPHVPGMERVAPDVAAAREKAAAEEKAREDAESGVSDARLRELKEKARADIEARLVARRKQRKLLRGGSVPGQKKQR